jgi:putative acetyltransferase
MIIRDERPEDRSAIGDVVAAAFGRPGEARLVERIRQDGDSVFSLVAVDGDTIVGYSLLSRMTAPFRAVGLGPVAVRPDRQGMGIGGRLIRAGIERATQTDWEGIFVLGNPLYYRRFGFDPALASAFACRYAGPHLMALALRSYLPTISGAITYAPAFALLD